MLRVGFDEAGANILFSEPVFRLDPVSEAIDDCHCHDVSQQCERMKEIYKCKTLR